MEAIEPFHMFWVLIPLGAFIYAAYEAKLKHERRMAELKATGESVEVAGLRRELADVKERLEVVERIVTDKSERLARDIDKLR
jgi:hypothetical protein